MWRRVGLALAIGGIATVAIAASIAPIDGNRRSSLIVLVTGAIATILVAGIVMQSWRTAVRATDEIEHALARLQEREQQLVQSNKELERFATIAAHDLQEPLRTILSYSSLMERKFADVLPGEALGYQLRVAAAAERMRLLIEDLLVYARIGQAEGHFDLFELRDALDSAIENVESLTDEVGAEIEIGQLPSVYGNRPALTQLFTNLLSNALKYRLLTTPKIRIAATRESNDEWWEVSVADNGKGIEPANHARIFELFRRLEPRDSTSGTGLGLAICARVVDAHGGRIWVDSTVGKGATFHFTLPVHRGEVARGRAGRDHAPTA